MGKKRRKALFFWSWFSAGELPLDEFLFLLDNIEWSDVGFKAPYDLNHKAHKCS